MSSHTTSGTPRRAAHALAGQSLVFRLEQELRELRRDLGRATGGRTAKTLTKAGGLRATLVALEAGTSMEPEATAGGATLHVIEGRIQVQTEGDKRELGPGELLALDHNLHDPLQAIERSAFLLTVAWPPGAGAWEQEAAAGHL